MRDALASGRTLRGLRVPVGAVRSTGRNATAGRRAANRDYHDNSYGYREPRRFTLPDCMCHHLPLMLHNSVLYVTDSHTQLENRTANAPLLRYVDSLRTHGHRAARIDPLDLLQREEVAALNPARYGLVDSKQKYNVDGIVWTTPVGAKGETRAEWRLDQITKHLRAIYVGNIAYEYMHSPSKTERLWFSHLLESQVNPSPMSNAEKLRAHELLARSEVFDQFMQAKFPNLKRYGLEGGESMLIAMEALFKAATSGKFNFVSF